MLLVLYNGNDAKGLLINVYEYILFDIFLNVRLNYAFRLVGATYPSY